TAIILGPNAVHEQFAHFPASSSLLPSDHLREVFSFYGISTLLPLIAVFMFVLFASAVCRIAHAIWSLLPGEMVFTSTVRLEKFADHADLVNLLAAYKLLKEPNSLNQLNDILELERAKASSAETVAAGLVFQRLDAKYRWLFAFIKFLGVFSCAI